MKILKMFLFYSLITSICSVYCRGGGGGGASQNRRYSASRSASSNSSSSSSSNAKPLDQQSELELPQDFNISNENILTNIIKRSLDPKLIPLSVQKGAQVNAQDSSGYTPLLTLTNNNAIYRRLPQYMSALLQAGALITPEITEGANAGYNAPMLLKKNLAKEIENSNRQHIIRQLQNAREILKTAYLDGQEYQDSGVAYEYLELSPAEKEISRLKKELAQTKRVHKWGQKSPNFNGYVQGNVSCMEFIRGPKQGEVVCFKSGTSMSANQASQKFNQLKSLYEEQTRIMQLINQQQQQPEPSVPSSSSSSVRSEMEFNWRDVDLD